MDERLVRVTFQPTGRSVLVEVGTTVVGAAQQLGLHINVPCGGRGICGKCRVEFVRGAPDPTAAEREHIAPGDLAAGWRLACQARILRPARIAIPVGAALEEREILTAGIGREVVLRPAVRKRFIHLPAPSLDDVRADADRLQEALSTAFDLGEVEVDFPLLADLPSLLRGAEFRLSAVLADRRLIALEAGDTTDRCYGVAVDLGTTTVVGTLFDLNTGRQLATASRVNPQTALGDDVVSRIHHAISQRDGRRQLQRRAVACLNEIVGELCRRASVKRRHIYEVTVVGNTTMQHLLLGIDPAPIAQAPYVAVLRSGARRSCRELGLRLGRGAVLYTMPSVAGFVGGDTVGVILACDLDLGSRTRLAVDIGTNGEMVLACGGEMVCCSTAAGPAFEGARITFGMRAAAGAVEAVGFDGRDLEVRTIDNAPARGICGTGLIEAVSTLLETGIIDATGRILNPEEVPNIPDALARRVRREEGGGNGVVLVWSGDTALSRDVVLTQRDIRQVQLAKAAIAAGVTVLLREQHLTPDQLEEVLLAGAFGNRLRPRCAVRVGLLPEVPGERVRFVGNAALEGARMVLLDATLRRRAEEVSRRTRYLELAGRPDFQGEFTEAMLFPTNDPA